MRAHHTFTSSINNSYRDRTSGDFRSRDDAYNVKQRHGKLDRSKLDASSRFYTAHNGSEHLQSARSVASRDSALFTEFVKNPDTFIRCILL